MNSIIGIKTEDFADLLNSKPFDVHKTSEAPEVNSCINHIIDICVSEDLIKRVTKESKRNLRTLVLDLYITYLHNPEVWIGVSRRSNDYQAGSRYNELHISYRPIIRGINCLLDLGFIEQHKGWKDRKSGKGFQTRIKATEKLIKLVSGYKVTKLMVTRSDNEETIVIKNKIKELIEYRDNEDIKISRFYVNFINKAIDSHKIGLNIGETEWKEIHDTIHRESDKTPIDTTKTKLYRVFNNSTEDADWLLEGGRFYGAFWLEIPSETRRHLLIDDKMTVEIDFSTLHPRILFSIEGLSSRFEEYRDIYDIEGIPRKLVKKAINVMLNSSNRVEAARASKIGLSQFVEVENRFTEISNYFYTGIGLYLQNVEAIIVQEIMLRVIEEGEIALPVHDSLICKVPYQRRLSEIMDATTGDYLQIFLNKVKVREGNGKVISAENALEALEELTFSETLDKEPNKEQYLDIHTKNK